MGEIEGIASEAIENAPEGRLNSAIAALVAITATFMAVCNIKDGNIVQAMAKVQTKAVDSWSYYQAKSTKQSIAEHGMDTIRLRLETEGGLTDAARERLTEAAKKYEGKVKRYDAEKEAIKKEAEGYEKTYDDLNVHDDQFDMAEACLSIAIALFGVAALTQKKWLFGMAFVLTIFGTILGLAGFLQWDLKVEWLAKLLG